MISHKDICFYTFFFSFCYVLLPLLFFISLAPALSPTFPSLSLSLPYHPFLSHLSSIPPLLNITHSSLMNDQILLHMLFKSMRGILYTYCVEKKKKSCKKKLKTAAKNDKQTRGKKKNEEKRRKWLVRRKKSLWNFCLKFIHILSFFLSILSIH